MNSKYENEYSVYSDDELIEKYRQGDAEIIDYLMRKYKNMVSSIAKSFFLLGGDEDDLVQEGMIGLFRAVNSYDFGRDASFHTYANLCVSRQILSAIKKSNDKKHSFLNNYISVFANNNDSVDDGDLCILENMNAGRENEPEDSVLSAELMQEIQKAIEKELSEMERESFELYLTGMGSGEIAKLLGRTSKETDNSIQRAKNKLRKIIEIYIK